ncbi:MAG: LacI family DNA-binding transcriptional regulator [Sporolactobacillus sp.]
MREKINAYDVAKIAHVSPATVSRVLHHKNNVNLATAQKVEEAIVQLGFHQSKNDDAVKIILLNVTDISNIFYTDVIEGVKAAANANNYQLLIDQTELNTENIQSFLTLIKNLHVYGLIVLKQLSSYILNKLSRSIRVVQCNEYNSEVDLPYVSIDDYSAARDATQQLILSGKRRICLLNGPRSFRYARERERGFKDTLIENDISITDDWIISLSAIRYEIALPVVSQLLSSKYHPDAFFCVSDTLGAAVIGAAHKYRLNIPNDIAIIGFDNTMISQIITPSLTTINQPKFQIGYSVVELLKNFDQEKQHIKLDTELIIRESI